MIGIIYKFTTYYEGKTYYYVGQHIDESEEAFLMSRKTSYWGSGKIWGDVLSSLRKRYPTSWIKRVKREILFSITNVNTVVLNRMERVYIKREKALFQDGNGGCNWLPGEARGDDWVNAMKHPDIRAKVSAKNRISLKGKMAGSAHPLYGTHRSEETRKKISETRKARGYKPTPQQREKMIAYAKKPKSPEHRRKIGDAQRGEKSVHWGKPLTADHRRKVGEAIKRIWKEKGVPVSGRIWITNGKTSKFHIPTLPIPKGFYKGRTL